VPTSLTFQYKHTPGVYKTAKATESYPANPGQHDSQWMVQDQGSDEWHGPYDWLAYFGHDRQDWKVKMHCGAAGGGMNFSFEIETASGHNNHDDQNIHFFDWDSNRWSAHVSQHIPHNPWTPEFEMTLMEG
jgi:hypothetical protein